MQSTDDSLNGVPIVLFASPDEWEAWLDEQHAASPGLWLRLAKKASGLQSVSYQEALDVALCYGWIDSQKKSYDEQSWLQKFSPRRARSIWSKVNREKVQRLIESGRMKAAGLREVEAAQQDGRWAGAYDSQSNATVPDDFQAELDKHPEAQAFFSTLNGANRYAILFRIQTAKKAETRSRRIQQLVEMLARQEKLHL
jgi:uncharacterized protein YdeI (YjbR/CyaY-like superfamily)